jgi:hypothetical protein
MQMMTTMKMKKMMETLLDQDLTIILSRVLHSKLKMYLKDYSSLDLQWRDLMKNRSKRHNQL